MPEMPDVIQGEPVEADWGNDIRSRTVQRYADEAARTAEHPFPAAGDLSYLVDSSQVQVFDGTVWLSNASGIPEAPIDALVYGRKDATWVVSVPEAPNDGIPYGRQSAGWIQVIRKSGDTMTGALVLAGSPAGGQDATPKTYVDTADGARVLKSGDTMTGPLIISVLQHPGGASGVMEMISQLNLRQTPGTSVPPNLFWQASDGRIYSTTGLTAFIDPAELPALNTLMGGPGVLRTYTDGTTEGDAIDLIELVTRLVDRIAALEAHH